MNVSSLDTWPGVEGQLKTFSNPVVKKSQQLPANSHQPLAEGRSHWPSPHHFQPSQKAGLQKALEQSRRPRAQRDKYMMPKLTASATASSMLCYIHKSIFKVLEHQRRPPDKSKMNVAFKLLVS